MHDPFSVLGLDRDADERAIKRAYAQRLRATRPDDDPDAFQALNEAYQRCLEIAAVSTEWEDEDEAPDGDALVDADRFTATLSHDALMAATGVLPTDDQETPEADTPDRFEAEDFLAELIRRAQHDSKRNLERWLRELPALYALNLKSALRLPVALEMSQADPPVRAANARVVVAFFGLDMVSPSETWLYAQAAQVLRHTQAVEDYDYEIALLRGEHTTVVDRLLVRELEAPTHWLRRTFIALVPGLPTRTLAWWRHLSAIDFELAQKRLNGRSIEFWRRATDHIRLGWERALIGSARAALYYLILVGIAALLMADHGFLDHAARNSGLAAAAWLLWISASTGLRWLSAWIAQRTPLDGPLSLATMGVAAALCLHRIQPDISMIFAGAALIGWTSAREPYTRKAMICASLGCVFSLNLIWGGGEEHPARALALGVATVIATDALYAVVKRVSLHEARSTTGWLWPLLGVAVTAMTAAGFATSFLA